MNMYDWALMSQSAVNASGLIHNLSKYMTEIWAEANEKGLGTDYVNKHPVLRLFLEQLVFLNGNTINDLNNSYHQASVGCKAKAEEERNK